MLILLHLFMRRKIAQPLLYLSPVFEARKEEYIDRMFAVSRDGDWEGWIVFFLQVLRDAARETIVLAERLIALQASHRVQMQQARRSSNLLTIIDYLFEQPVLTIPMIAERLDVTYKAAQKNVELLIAERVLSEVEGTSNPRYFAARDIIKITSGK
jgi:Fic family protein